MGILFNRALRTLVLATFLALLPQYFFFRYKSEIDPKYEAWLKTQAYKDFFKRYEDFTLTDPKQLENDHVYFEQNYDTPDAVKLRNHQSHINHQTQVCEHLHKDHAADHSFAKIASHTSNILQKPPHHDKDNHHHVRVHIVPFTIFNDEKHVNENVYQTQVVQKMIGGIIDYLNHNPWAKFTIPNTKYLYKYFEKNFNEDDQVSVMKL